jgi:predicted enzyme related to lactoylglutathione lyase
MPPTYGNGKICYVEIPATDIPRSVAFYQTVFGWNIRRRGDGQTALTMVLAKSAAPRSVAVLRHRSLVYCCTSWSTAL